MSDVTIPEDVWTIADGVWLELANLGETAVSRREAEAEIIARAIVAERERCAKIAETIAAEDDGSAWDYEVGRSAGADAVAQAIRSSHE